jgi:hypothetical protein
VNLATPLYPADDTTCCPVGDTLRERLVTDGHLDCSVGRPCVATTNTPEKGTLAAAMWVSRYRQCSLSVFGIYLLIIFCSRSPLSRYDQCLSSVFRIDYFIHVQYSCDLFLCIYCSHCLSFRVLLIWKTEDSACLQPSPLREALIRLCPLSCIFRNYDNQGLTGTMPPEIMQLTSLVTMWVRILIFW